MLQFDKADVYVTLLTIESLKTEHLNEILKRADTFFTNDGKIVQNRYIKRYRLCEFIFWTQYAHSFDLWISCEKKIIGQRIILILHILCL